jgi:GTP-binding protein
MPIKALRRDGKLIETRPRLQGARLPRPGAPADRGRPKPATSSRIAGLTKATVADTICDPQVSEPIQAQPIDPPTLSMTFRVNDSPLAGARRQGAEPRDPRPPDEGSGRQRRPEASRNRRAGRLHRFRARRTSAGDPDRDHAPRRLRAGVGRPRVVFQTATRERQAAGADRGSHHRRRRGILRHVVQKLAERKGDLVEMRPPAAASTRLVFHVPDARPDRLSGRVPDRHPRHRDHEPPVPRLRALQGTDPGPPYRRADLQRNRARRWPMRCGTWKTAAR